jgi:hypothetical protein
MAISIFVDWARLVCFNFGLEVLDGVSYGHVAYDRLCVIH